MNSLIDQIRASFQQNEWVFEEAGRDDVIESGFEAQNARVPLHVQVFPPLHAVNVVARSPLDLSEPDRRIKTAELLMQANQQLSLGAFEMLWDEGTVLFRAGNVFPEGRYHHGTLSMLVEVAVVEMDRLAPCLHILATVPTAKLPEIDAAGLLAQIEPDS